MHCALLLRTSQSLSRLIASVAVHYVSSLFYLSHLFLSPHSIPRFFASSSLTNATHSLPSFICFLSLSGCSPLYLPFLTLNSAGRYLHRRADVGAASIECNCNWRLTADPTPNAVQLSLPSPFHAIAIYSSPFLKSAFIDSMIKQFHNRFFSLYCNSGH